MGKIGRALFTVTVTRDRPITANARYMGWGHLGAGQLGADISAPTTRRRYQLGAQQLGASINSAPGKKLIFLK